MLVTTRIANSVSVASFTSQSKSRWYHSLTLNVQGPWIYGDVIFWEGKEICKKAGPWVFCTIQTLQLLSVCLGLHIAGNYLNHSYFILRNIVIIMKIPWTIKTVLITLHDALLLQGEQGLEGSKGETGEKVILCVWKEELCSQNSLMWHLASFICSIQYV